MPLVTKWTGREVKALREAIRMSLMEFAEKLGVSDRIVSRWEADGEYASLRMVNQAALDTLLAKADQDAQGRFVGILAAEDVPAYTVIEPDEDQTSSGEYVKHPGDGKLMAHIPEGIFLSGEGDESRNAGGSVRARGSCGGCWLAAGSHLLAVGRVHASDEVRRRATAVAEAGFYKCPPTPLRASGRILGRILLDRGKSGNGSPTFCLHLAPCSKRNFRDGAQGQRYCWRKKNRCCSEMRSNSCRYSCSQPSLLGLEACHYGRALLLIIESGAKEIVELVLEFFEENLRAC